MCSRWISLRAGGSEVPTANGLSLYTFIFQCPVPPPHRCAKQICKVIPRASVSASFNHRLDPSGDTTGTLLELPSGLFGKDQQEIVQNSRTLYARYLLIGKQDQWGTGYHTATIRFRSLREPMSTSRRISDATDSRSWVRQVSEHNLQVSPSMSLRISCPCVIEYPCFWS